MDVNRLLWIGYTPRDYGNVKPTDMWAARRRAKAGPVNPVDPRSVPRKGTGLPG